jgi:hypothetical protein
MSWEQAESLVEFVKDHDKRFSAKAKTDDEPDCWVLLVRASDETELPPVSDLEQYRADHIEGDDPGPTVRAAWEKWLAERAP